MGFVGSSVGEYLLVIFGCDQQLALEEAANVEAQWELLHIGFWIST